MQGNGLVPDVSLFYMLQFFIKQLALELLDRRLTIVQQPRHRLAQLEAACRRQFPAFNERQIRLKIRGQLKLYRRNLKKAEERKLTKPNALSQPSSAFECLPLTSIDPNPSYLACNPNAVWMARRALANERKRGKPLITPSTDALPLKPINDWQNVSTLAEPIVTNRPSPVIRPVSLNNHPILYLIGQRQGLHQCACSVPLVDKAITSQM